MAMMTDAEKEKWKMVGIIAVVIVVAYLIVAYAGFLPNAYNVFKMGKQETVTPTVPTHASGEGWIEGIPTEVNVTDYPTYTINLTCACNKSYMGGMVLNLSVDDSHSDVWFTATSPDWVISTDGLQATYIGADLTGGVSISTLTINLDNTGLTAAATMTITADASLGTLDTTDFTVDFVL